jgi:hypothetical protein
LNGAPDQASPYPEDSANEYCRLASRFATGPCDYNDV